MKLVLSSLIINFKNMVPKWAKQANVFPLHWGSFLSGCAACYESTHSNVEIYLKKPSTFQPVKWIFLYHHISLPNVLKRGPSLGFRDTPQTLWYPTIFWMLPQVLMTITEWLQGKDKSSPGLETLCIQEHCRPGSSLRTACSGLTGNTLRTSRATFNHCESLFQCHHSTWELRVILGS